MIKARKKISHNDPFDLSRFMTAQDKIYETAIAELRSGQKRTHWMWYIFPQIDGLAKSTTSKYYAIKSIEEAREYLNHPILGTRLLECATVVFGIKGRSISEIFDDPDDLKLKSSMTLFAYLTDTESVFASILARYFNGDRDVKTLHILEQLNN